MDALVSEVVEHEKALLRGLTVGTAVSAVVGLTALAWGALRHERAATAFGRQTVVWALVDGVIAAVGRRGLATPPVDAEAALGRARRLRTVTAANAVLDVGYVTLGVALTRRERETRSEAVAEGVAVVLQGGFLLVLDTHHALRAHRLLRDRD